MEDILVSRERSTPRRTEERSGGEAGGAGEENRLRGVRSVRSVGEEGLREREDQRTRTLRMIQNPRVQRNQQLHRPKRSKTNK